MPVDSLFRRYDILSFLKKLYVFKEAVAVAYLIAERYTADYAESVACMVAERWRLAELAVETVSDGRHLAVAVSYQWMVADTVVLVVLTVEQTTVVQLGLGLGSVFAVGAGHMGQLALDSAKLVVAVAISADSAKQNCHQLQAV